MVVVVVVVVVVVAAVVLVVVGRSMGGDGNASGGLRGDDDADDDAGVKSPVDEHPLNNNDDDDDARPTQPTPEPTPQPTTTTTTTSTTTATTTKEDTPPPTLSLTASTSAILTRLQTLFPNEPLSPAVKRAVAGGGYAPRVSQSRATIALYGKQWADGGVLPMLGCPIHDGPAQRGGCPYRPKCHIFWTTDHKDLTSGNVDVAVFMAKEDVDARSTIALTRLLPPAVVRVMYQREAVWDNPYPNPRAHFDVDMSFRPTAGVGNPFFVNSPQGLFAYTERWRNLTRPEFAMSLISDCRTRSHREEYVSRLLRILGPSRLHQYGDCGDGKHKLVRHHFFGMQAYKFYFAFENTIMPNYVTEKLFSMLSYGPVPVYFGAPNVMELTDGITTTPSFINAMNFSSPGALAKHLLWLADNPAEYEKYHEWRRRGPNALTPKYLDLAARLVPGPDELAATVKTLGKEAFATRRAACCRLCDLEFMRSLVVPRGGESQANQSHPLDSVKERWTVPQISKAFFGGTLVVEKG